MLPLMLTLAILMHTSLSQVNLAQAALEKATAKRTVKQQWGGEQRPEPGFLSEVQRVDLFSVSCQSSFFNYYVVKPRATKNSISIYTLKRVWRGTLKTSVKLLS